MTKPRKHMRLIPFRHPMPPHRLLWRLQVDNGRDMPGAMIGVYSEPGHAMTRAITGKKAREQRGWKQAGPQHIVGPAQRYPDGSGHSEIHFFPKRPPYPEH